METNLSPDNSPLSEKIAKMKHEVIERIIMAKHIKTKFQTSICFERELVNPIIDLFRASIQEAQKRFKEWNESDICHCSDCFDGILIEIFSSVFGDFSDNNVGVVSEGSCDINSEKGLHKAGSNPAPDTKIQNICECGGYFGQHDKDGCMLKGCSCKKFTPKKTSGSNPSSIPETRSFVSKGLGE